MVRLGEPLLPTTRASAGSQDADGEAWLCTQPRSTALATPYKQYRSASSIEMRMFSSML